MNGRADVIDASALGGGRVEDRALEDRAVEKPAVEKRAVFDFEIAFSNGGGLKGWDFRLDIDGDDIDDAALADYIVRDLRLLMVGSVRIDNKRIIEEAHKRRASD